MYASCVNVTRLRGEFKRRGTCVYGNASPRPFPKAPIFVVRALFGFWRKSALILFDHRGCVVLSVFVSFSRFFFGRRQNLETPNTLSLEVISAKLHVSCSSYLHSCCFCWKNRSPFVVVYIFFFLGEKCFFLGKTCFFLLLFVATAAFFCTHAS